MDTRQNNHHDALSHGRQIAKKITLSNPLNQIASEHQQTLIQSFCVDWINDHLVTELHDAVSSHDKRIEGIYPTSRRPGGTN